MYVCVEKYGNTWKNLRTYSDLCNIIEPTMIMAMEIWYDIGMTNGMMGCTMCREPWGL